MATFLNTMIERAKTDVKTIVLPEGNDDRTLEAAQKITEQGIAKVIVLGDAAEIAAKDFNLEGVEVIDYKTSELRQELADGLYELRKAKGMTPEDALASMDKPMYFGTMLLKTGRADGLVAGAVHSTKDVLGAGLRVIKTAPGAKMVSSFFMMEVPDCEFGNNGLFLFSDCGLCIQPNAEELSEIALASARSWEALVGEAPRVAMLSHSTYGSAKDADADKVIEALRLVREKNADLQVDGEMQLDAAIVPSVGQAKAPGSAVAGQANCLIFPDLDAGNIGYKLTQRLAKAEAYGPITQGLGAPMNDLSRGCSADDIVGVVAITAVQAQQA